MPVSKETIDVAIPDLTIMSHQTYIKNSDLLRDILNINITNRRTVHTKEIYANSFNGSDELQRPIFSPSARFTLGVDRGNVDLVEYSGIAEIDRQQIAEGGAESEQYIEEGARHGALQILQKYYKDINTILTTAGNFVADREQAAAATWSTVATATPYTDLVNLTKKMLASGKISRIDNGLRFLISENLADLVVATDDYKNQMNKVTIVESPNIEENLTVYFKMPVRILSGYYYGRNSSQIFDDNIAVLLWKDMDNAPESGLMASSNIVKDSSSLALVMKDLSNEFDFQGMSVSSLSAMVNDQLLSFARPVIATKRYTTNGGRTTNIDSMSDGGLFINNISKLTRLTSLV